VYFAHSGSYARLNVYQVYAEASYSTVPWFMANAKIVPGFGINAFIGTVFRMDAVIAARSFGVDAYVAQYFGISAWKYDPAAEASQSTLGEITLGDGTLGG
jgi:hypothetical protein